jgi:hypothetical protein
VVTVNGIPIVMMLTAFHLVYPLNHRGNYSETPIQGLSGDKLFCTLNGGFGKQVPKMTVKFS